MKNILFTAGLSTLIALAANAQQPRLSPRPQSVKGIETTLISLNGSWQFSNGLAGKTAAIEVPGEWEMQGHTLQEGDTAVYSRTFQVPANWAGQRIRIRFDGVSSWGKVLVNGQPVAEHEGGFVPFEADITSAVRTGNNRLQVLVRARTISDQLGCISQYAAHTVGGILRKVSLFVLPPVHMAQLDVTPHYTPATLGIDMKVDGSSAAKGRLAVHYRLMDREGKTVFDKILPLTATDSVQHHELHIGKAKEWNPETPYLYRLAATLTENGVALETVEQRTGFRDMKIVNGQLLVNGRPVKLRGVNRHEVHPLRGRSLTPELCRQDAEIFKKGNCNYIRTSHYPPSEEFLEAADELGLFVESEAALVWVQHGAAPIWGRWNYLDEKLLPYMINANVEKVIAERNHPSIIIWSLANESYWSPLFARVNEVVKQLDPSRPTTFHDQCWGEYNNGGNKADIAVYHYPDIRGPGATDTMSRPVLFGEYAHVSCYNRREVATDPGIRAAYGAPLAKMYDTMFHHPRCLGGAIWAGIDDIFYMPDGRQVGYGPWGPVDGWRREKPEYFGMKKAYSPVAATLPGKSAQEGKVWQLPVENRFDFTTLRPEHIVCRVDGVERKINANIPPHGNEMLSIPVSSNTAEIYLAFRDPQGITVDEELVQLREPHRPETKTTVPVSFSENEQAYFIQQGSNTFTISRSTGQLTARNNGRQVLSQGPLWSVVTMNGDDGGMSSMSGENYQKDIVPLKSYPLQALFVTDLDIRKTDSAVIVREKVSYQPFNGPMSGALTYYFRTDGKVRMEYEISYQGGGLHPRQYGMVLQLPPSFNRLSWQSKGPFSLYPEHDIARNRGTALLNAQREEASGKAPAGPWKDDSSEQGSNDFRSTKSNILQASLQDADNTGIVITSDGSQAVRCWLQDARIQLLVADYSNPGAERFYSAPFTDTRKLLPPVVKGQLVFYLQ